MSTCRWVQDKEIGRFHLPGCMGAAVYGPRGCTCDKRRERKGLEERMSALEARMAKLERAAALCTHERGEP